MVSRRAPIRREEYEALAGPSLSRVVWHKPELRPIEFRGRAALVKDYRRCPLAVRLTYGRLMVAREVAIYNALRGLEGIPAYLGRIDADAFVVERVFGDDLSAYRRGMLDAVFVDRLEAVVRGMHDRGVFHGDLRQRRNVIVGPGRTPYLIDFASAIRLPPGSSLLRHLARIDLSGVAKLRKKHAPETITREDGELLALERWRPFKKAKSRKRADRRREKGLP